MKGFFQVVVIEFADALKMIDSGGGGEEAEGRVLFFYAIDEDRFELGIGKGRQ